MNANFPRAVRHLAELSAISRLADYSESVKELVLQVVAVAEEEPMKTPEAVKEALDVFFGIPLGINIISEAIVDLEGSDQLRRDLYGSYCLEAEAQKFRMARIAESQQLQEAVFNEWAQEIAAIFPSGARFSKIRRCIEEYLAEAFRRHGLETAQILDNNSSIATEDTESLVATLGATISKHFAGEDPREARAAITTFFAHCEEYPKRRKYLIELADGAFSFYTFLIDPDVSRRLRESLRKIEFYLDTNFLWGLLGLHDNQYVQASLTLFKAVKENHLPFSFRYHKITEQELLRSVTLSAEELRKMTWKRNISEQLRKSPYVSGIERNFHEGNARSAMDVETFLQRYENVPMFVQDQGITIDNREIDWGPDVNDLYNEYKEYLEHLEVLKGYEIIQHDARMLYLTRKFRSNNKSPLQAGTLFLTCDGRLYNFDIRNSKKHHVWPCTILPNVLLQILRPVIQDNPAFDALFVKTFALPEFRSYSKKASLAVQMMAEILSSVDGFPEPLAQQMLLDGLLVKAVSETGGKQEAVAVIEKALAERVKKDASEIEEIRGEIDRLNTELRSGKESTEELRREMSKRVDSLSVLAGDQAKRVLAESLMRERVQADANERATSDAKVIGRLILLVSGLAGLGIGYVAYRLKYLNPQGEHKAAYGLLAMAVFFLGASITYKKKGVVALACISIAAAAVIQFLGIW